MPIALLLALAIGAGVPQPGDDTARAATTIDVIVEDASGRAAETLQPSDFTITERSAPLTIEAVRFVRPLPNAPASPHSSAGPDDNTAHTTSRLFGIFLDEFHVTPGPEAERARAALIRFIREDLAPGDLLTVVKPLDSLLDLKSTADHEAVIRIVESFEPRRGNYAPSTSFERDFIAGAPARIEGARAQIASSSLDALATHLGQFSPARKTLIVLSEGFQRTAHRRGDELLPGVDSIVQAANRAHVSIYAIDPRPVRSPQAPADDSDTDGVAERTLREGLRALAERTAGRVLTLAGDLSAQLTRVARDANGYYVLTLPEATGGRDGRFHPVDVSVRRAGLSVRARAGYWSLAEPVPPVTGASRSFASQFVRRTSPLIRPWFGTSRGSSGATRVSFVWEPAPRIPGDRTPSPTPAMISLTVTTLDGEPIFDGVVAPTNSGFPEGLGGRQSRVSFESPAGRLLVRMAIEDAGSRVLDREVRDLVVGGFPGPVTIGSAEVLRARNAREFKALAADPQASPVATRQFSRADRLLVRVPVFSTGRQPVLSARLVSALGSRMRDLTVTPSPSAFAPFQVDVPLAALAAGTYNVELVAKTPEGEAHETLTLRVTP